MADPKILSGELAGLLQVSVPVLVKLLRNSSYNSRLKSIDDELKEGAELLDPIWAKIPLQRKIDLRKVLIDVIDQQKNLKLQPWWRSVAIRSTELERLNNCMEDARQWNYRARATSTEFTVINTLTVCDSEPAAAVIPTPNPADVRLMQASNNVGVTNPVELFTALSQQLPLPPGANVIINNMNYNCDVRYKDGVAYNNAPAAARNPALTPDAAGCQDAQALDSSTDAAQADPNVNELIKAMADVVVAQAQADLETQSISFNPWS